MQLTLVEKKEEVLDVISFIFKTDAPLDWIAGQYLRYHIEDPVPDERRTDRYFTIATAPFEKNVMLTTRFDPGDGSTFKKDLKNLKIGSNIDVQGPWGEFIIEDLNQKYVFLAGGIGITPFRSILLDLDHRKLPINATLLYANRDQNIAYRQEFEKLLPDHPNFKIHYVIDPQRIDEQFIRSTINDVQLPIFFVSGPKPMVQAMEKMLADMGISTEHIKHDYFPGYEEI